MTANLRITPPDPDTLRVAEQAFLAVQRGAGTGNLVMMECRVEGNLNGELVANHFVFSFEIIDGLVASMYEYATWTAKHPTSRWGDVTFAREAFR